MYREGHHSVQVDILIMAWRQWENSYFPPPQGNPIPQPNPHDLPQLHDDHTISINHSSSSSSNDAPSEPTIDYSSWSPRSNSLHRCSSMAYQTMLDSLFKWITKTKLGQPKLLLPPNPNPLDCNPTSPPPATNCSLIYQPGLSISNRTHMPAMTHRPHQISATVQHKPRGNIRTISTLINALMLTIPSPISLNPFLSLRSLHCTTLIRLEHSIDATPYLIDNLSVVQHENKEGGNTQAYLDDVQDNTDLPDIYAHLGLTSWAAICQGPMNAHPQTPSQAQTQPLTSAHAHSKKKHSSTPPPQSASSPTPLQHSPELHNKRHGIYAHPIQDVMLPSHTTPDPEMSHVPERRKKKDKQPPTRRSMHIKAKTQTAKVPGKAMSRLTKIPFDLHTALTPLDTGTTLLILQASGLQIDNRVEQLIDDALNQDQAEATTQLNTPSTPLHDLIPPLLVLGTDILL